MRIVLHVIGSLDQGGAEKVALDLCRSIPSNEVLQVFYCFSGQEGALAESFRAAGATVIAAPKGSLFNRVAGLRSAVRSSRADVVVSHVSLASAFLLLAVRTNVSIRIARIHSTGDGKSGVHRGVYRWVARMLLPFAATHVLAVSQSALSFAVGGHRNLYRRLGVRARVLVNGVDTRRFFFDRAPGGQGAVRVAHVGRASPEKNRVALPPIFIALTRDEPNIEMWIVGPGGTSDLVDIPDSDRFVIVGAVDDAATILKQIDVLLLPSIREGLPGVVLEALASGVPVVASDLPTLRELRELPGMTLIDPCAPADSWADAVLESVQISDESRHAIAKALSESRFTLERSVRDWLECWRSSDDEKGRTR